MQNPTAMLHLNVVMEKPSIQTRETPPPPGVGFILQPFGRMKPPFRAINATKKG